MGEDAHPLPAPTRLRHRQEATLVQEIRIEFTRFSAFYSPLIATIAGGFLKQEGLDAQAFGVGARQIGDRGPGRRLGARVPIGAIARASRRSSRARSRLPLHFAQINEKDGFFLAGRSPDQAFTWDKLKGKKVIVDHGGQPMAMFKYACFKRGLDFKAIDAIDAGSTDKMIAAFRKGEGDYIHLQGPAPAAARARRRRPHRRCARRCDRPVRLLEPGRDARMARHRHGQALHARLPQGARLADRHARRRGRQGRGAVLQGHRPAPS